MNPAALPLPLWQIRKAPIGAFFFACVLAGLFSFVALMGCQGCSGSLPVPTTPRERARAAVLVLAEGVRVADHQCASVAGDAGRLDVLDRCAVAYVAGRDALLVAAGAVDAYDSGRAGDVTCATYRGLDAARTLAEGIRSVGGQLPPALDDGLKLAAAFASEDSCTNPNLPPQVTQ